MWVLQLWCLSGSLAWIQGSGMEGLWCPEVLGQSLEWGEERVFPTLGISGGFMARREHKGKVSVARMGGRCL